MPTFQDPTADADEAAHSLRGLAHATRSLENPSDVYAVLGSLTGGQSSLRQVLVQLACHHVDSAGPARDDPANQAAAQLATNLSRASRLVSAAAAAVDRAHEAEGKFEYPPSNSLRGDDLLPGMDSYGIDL